MSTEERPGLMEEMLAALKESNAQSKQLADLEIESRRADEEQATKAEQSRAEALKRAERIAADRERLLLAGERQAAALEKIANILHAWNEYGVPPEQQR